MSVLVNRYRITKQQSFMTPARPATAHSEPVEGVLGWHDIMDHETETHFVDVRDVKPGERLIIEMVEP